MLTNNDLSCSVGYKDAQKADVQHTKHRQLRPMERYNLIPVTRSYTDHGMEIR